MTIKTAVYAALATVLPNTHAIQLPDRPTFPAIVFEIETTPEEGWVLGGVYEQHVVTVVMLDGDLDANELRKPQIRAVMAAIPGFMADEDHGDADYEPDPQVYAYFMNFRIRQRQ
jgi:hypothetical protein